MIMALSIFLSITGHHLMVIPIGAMSTPVAMVAIAISIK